MTDKLRIIFMGTPDFATPTLKALCESKHDVVGVVTNPDRAAGRGKKMTPPPVKVVAESYSIPVFQPKKVRKNKELQENLSALNPDLAVVVAYGQILSQPFLDLPTHGCLNVHASILPKFRGASPINAAIIHGEQESGVSIMKMELGLDTGPVLAVKTTPIYDYDSAQDLHDRLANIGARIIVDVAERWCRREIEPTTQDDASSSYAPMMKKEDGNIDWSNDAVSIDRLIRGLYPWPGAYTSYLSDNIAKSVKIHRANLVDNKVLASSNLDSKPGCIATPDLDTLLVRCGHGALQITELQPAGKRSMHTRDFINGFQPTANDRFV